MVDITNSAWSETDASNNSASPNGWASGTMTPVEVEPTARMMMGAIKRFYDHINASAQSGGSANVHTLTYAVAPNSYVVGDCYAFFPGTSNTGATTLNVNGLGAKTCRVGGSAFTGGEFTMGRVAVVYYDGTYFQSLNPIGPITGATLNLTGAGTIGGILGVGGLQINTTSTPASASAAGITGTIAWDASYLYVCIATNTWKRVAIATW